MFFFYHFITETLRPYRWRWTSRDGPRSLTNRAPQSGVVTGPILDLDVWTPLVSQGSRRVGGPRPEAGTPTTRPCTAAPEVGTPTTQPCTAAPEAGTDRRSVETRRPRWKTKSGSNPSFTQPKRPRRTRWGRDWHQGSADFIIVKREPRAPVDHIKD